jgi:MFS family permease
MMTTDAARPSPRTRPRTSVRARRIPLFGLLAAQGLSLAGNAITMIVVPLYVLHVTGSVLATGVAGVFATVPVIIGGALGGVLVDRIGFQLAGIIADLASGLTVVAIPVLAATVGLPFGALLALVFLSGLLDTPGNTAKAALLPDLAEAADVQLTRATGAQSAISRTATMVGAALAALSVVWLGPLNSLLLDAATFAVSAALLWGCVPRAAGRSAAAARAEAAARVTEDAAAAGPDAESMRPAGYWRELGDGIRFLASTPLIRNLVLMIVITNCFDAAGMTVIFPVYARTISPDGAPFGAMVAIFAFGALAGASLFGWFGHRLPRRGTLVVCFLLAGAPPYLAMAAGLPVPAVFAVFGLAGLAAGSINPMLSTVLFGRIPRGMRARVLGALTTGVSAGMPVGSFLGGLAVSEAGLAPTLLAIGGCYAAVTLSPLVGRSWRALDARPGSVPVPVPAGQVEPVSRA